MKKIQELFAIGILIFFFYGCSKEPIDINESSNPSYSDGDDLTYYYRYNTPSTSDNCEAFDGDFGRSFRICFNRYYSNNKFNFSCGLKEYSDIELAAPYSLNAYFNLKKYNEGDMIGSKESWTKGYRCDLLSMVDYQDPKTVIPCISYWVNSINGGTTQTITLAEGYVGVRKPIYDYNNYSSYAYNGQSPKGYIYGYIKLKIYQDYFEGDYWINVQVLGAGFKKTLDTPISAGE